MIAVQVMANDVAVGFGGAGGYLEMKAANDLQHLRRRVRPQPARHLSRARRARPLTITRRFSLQDFAYSLELTLACLTAFWIITCILRPFV
jgi:hypothetical protein